MTIAKETKIIERSLGEFLTKHDVLIAQGYKVLLNTCYKSTTGLQAAYILEETPEPAAKPKPAAKKATKKVTEE